MLHRVNAPGKCGNGRRKGRILLPRRVFNFTALERNCGDVCLLHFLRATNERNREEGELSDKQGDSTRETPKVCSGTTMKLPKKYSCTRACIHTLEYRTVNLVIAQRVSLHYVITHFYPGRRRESSIGTSEYYNKFHIAL